MLMQMRLQLTIQQIRTHPPLQERKIEIISMNKTAVPQMRVQQEGKQKEEEYLIYLSLIGKCYFRLFQAQKVYTATEINLTTLK